MRAHGFLVFYRAVSSSSSVGEDLMDSSTRVDDARSMFVAADSARRA
jgi:hypothetical protein